MTITDEMINAAIDAAWPGEEIIFAEEFDSPEAMMRAALTAALSALHAKAGVSVKEGGLLHTADGDFVRYAPEIATLEEAYAYKDDAAPPALSTTLQEPVGEKARLLKLSQTILDQYPSDESYKAAADELAELVKTTVTGGINILEAQREALTEILASELWATYRCNRVWSAWGVGTMSEDDFEPTDERAGEIADSIIRALAALKSEGGNDE